MNAKAREERVIGPYRLVERIGAGGQGIVWRGFKGEGGEAVAVKVLRLSHPKKRARFIREVGIHSALSAADARNVMPLLDHNLEEVEGNGVQGYIAMPLAEVSLHDVIETLRERLELSLELLCGIATGLAAAHRAGVIHRDLKPGNILFTNRALREPLISDFGICLLRETPDLDRITEVGETVGAKYFMAPEQEHGGVSEVTFAADVYAAGKLLHFMLTGRYLVRERLDTAFTKDELAREPRLQIVLDDFLSRTVVEEASRRLQTGSELLKLCQGLLASFRAPSAGLTLNGGSLRKAYESFTQSFLTGDSPSVPLIFDELRDELRSSWRDLQARHETSGQDAAGAAEMAEGYVRSRRNPLAATLAMARLNGAPLFSQFKRLLEFTTDLSEETAGYAAVATISHVEAGFLYMSATVLSLHHEAWDLLEKLVTAKFKWMYQSPHAHYSYGFDHPYFFHAQALEEDGPRQNDLFRSVLMDPAVVEVTRLEKEQLIDAYAQADLLMCLKAAQVREGGEDVSRWADFGRFYGERVTPLLERIQEDQEFAAGVLRAFGELRDEFLSRLTSRLLFIRRDFFGNSRYRYASIAEWHER